MSGKIKCLFMVFLLLLTAQISGCLTAGLGPQFTQPAEPEAGKAIIYVYRERVAMTGSDVPGVLMNDVQVVKALPEVNYFPIAVAPGSYIFSPKLFGLYQSTPVTVDVEAGQVVYVKFRLTLGHLAFAKANRDEAMAYMATCYMINPKQAVDPRVMVSQKQAPAPEVVPAAKSVPAAQPPAVAKAEKVEPAIVKPTKAELYVDPVPSNARIRIMNIKPKFHQGITLNGGRYHIEVSAPDYKKYLRWISVEKGEIKRLQVVLDKKSRPQPVVSKASETVIVPAANVSKKSQPEAVKVPANASSEEKRYAGLFQSNSAVDIRNAAKNLYHRYPDSQYLAAAAEQCLLRNYARNPRDNMHVDAMAWLCKALARTGDDRFTATLKTVAETAPSRKLKKYAQKSLKQL